MVLLLLSLLLGGDVVVRRLSFPVVAEHECALQCPGGRPRVRREAASFPGRVPRTHLCSFLPLETVKRQGQQHVCHLPGAVKQCVTSWIRVCVVFTLCGDKTFPGKYAPSIFTCDHARACS